jgi:hypothetical protein
MTTSLALPVEAYLVRTYKPGAARKNGLAIRAV